MKSIIKAAFALTLLLSASSSFSQGKYFEVACKKGAYNGDLIGGVQPLNNQNYVVLPYKNKSKKDLLRIVQSYVKSRPALKLEHLDAGEGAFLVYRDFATVGSKDKCFADLVALTHVSVIPENGEVKVSLGLTSVIFASIFDAKLKISPDGDVASDGDLPFNEYKYMQPDDERVLTSNVWVGTRSKKRDLKSAYPDSVFDPKGKIINPVNKQLIESFYDGYVADLKTFIDQNLK